ncbi:hypothetical protein BLNAU_20275 [Blattamonas nauphoetae]|uniref:Uncharacterized protein n=1 Tax=Blattamonas nauphoetae TaxID=2049346 RepID=A0ABQ9X1J6_9EUKA|nr:hypothetical protein BLNAU_20275 [Blattamonas nauphoetae]
MTEFASFLVSSPLRLPSSLIVKWFTELVLSLAAGQHHKLLGDVLRMEDIVIDRFFSFHIQSTSDESHLPLHPPSTFASDLPLLSSDFGDFLESLQSSHRLFPPQTINTKDVITIITLTSVRHLVQCGILSSEGLSQQDLLQHLFHQLIFHLQKQGIFRINPIFIYSEFNSTISFNTKFFPSSKCII